MSSPITNTALKYNLGNEINCCGTADSTVPIPTYNTASGIAYLYNIGKQVTSCDSYIGFSGNQIIQTTLTVKQKYALGLEQCSDEYLAYLSSSSSSQVVWCANNPILCWAQSSSSDAQFCIDFPIACWYNSSSSSHAAWCAANPVPCASSSSSQNTWCAANPIPCASSSSEAAWCQQNPLPCAWQEFVSSSSSSHAAWCAANPVPCASSSSSHAAWCAANPVPCASSSSQAAWCAANPVPCASSQLQDWLSSSSSSQAAWCAANPVSCASSSSQAAWCAANPIPCIEYLYSSSSSSAWCAANPVICSIINSSSSAAAWCAANPVPCASSSSSHAAWCQENALICWVSSSSSSAAAWCAANPIICASSSSSHAAWCAANPVPCASSSSQAVWCAANPVPCASSQYQDWLSSSSSSSFEEWCESNPVSCVNYSSSSSQAAWCIANPISCASSSSQAAWCLANPIPCASSSSQAAWCIANPVACYLSSSSSSAAFCIGNPWECAQNDSYISGCTGDGRGWSGCCKELALTTTVANQISSKMINELNSIYGNNLVSRGEPTSLTSACEDRPCCVYGKITGQAYIPRTVQICTSGWEDYTYLQEKCVTASITGNSGLTGIVLDTPLVINGYARYNVSKTPFKIPSPFYVDESPSFTPNCAGGHVCSRARFIPVAKFGSIEINGTPEINLDNVGGATDLKKIPIGASNQAERESYFTITLPQNLNTTEFWSNANFYLKCNTSNNNCHNGITYVVLNINGTNTTIFNSCIVPGQFNQKPIVTLETKCQDIELTGQRLVTTCVPSGYLSLENVVLERKFLLPWKDPASEGYNVEITDNCPNCGDKADLPITETIVMKDPVFSITRGGRPDCAAGTTARYADWEDNGPDCLNKILYMYVDTSYLKVAVYTTNRLVPRIGGSVLDKIEIIHYDKSTKQTSYKALNSQNPEDLTSNPTFVFHNGPVEYWGTPKGRVVVSVRVAKSDDAGHFFELDTNFNREAIRRVAVTPELQQIINGGTGLQDVITLGGGLAFVLKRVTLEYKTQAEAWDKWVLAGRGQTATPPPAPSPYWASPSGPTIDGFSEAGAPFGLSRKHLEAAALFGRNSTEWAKVMFAGSEFADLLKLTPECRPPISRPWDPTPQTSSSSSNFAALPVSPGTIANIFI